MPEIIGSFAGSEGTRESADPAAQARNCSFCGLAQVGLEVAERHLDRVQIRRVFDRSARCDASLSAQIKTAFRSCFFLTRNVDGRRISMGKHAKADFPATDC
jgi:hypothetical protein